MSGTAKRPHDKLFRTVFADTDEAESFLHAYLPAALVKRLDWSTLKLAETSFVDEALRESESDLLFTVQVAETAESAYLYLLFEHQSTPDPWMRFRLLKYMCRIWDESFKESPEQSELRPVVPVVFYQGKTNWRYSTEFTELFPERERENGFLPRFAHYLIDQSGVAPEAVRGGLKAKVAQLLLMAAFHEPVRRALLLAEQLLNQVVETGGMNYVKVFVVYLAATQERRVVQEFVAEMQRFQVDVGGDFVTYAEELLQEGEIRGEIRGEIKGKIETIESLLAVGAEWALITKATGMTPQEFEVLKEQVRNKAAAHEPF